MRPTGLNRVICREAVLQMWLLGLHTAAAQRHLRRDLETLIYLMFSREKEEMVMCESQHDISPRRS